MPIKIDNKLTPKKLLPKIERLFELSARKILQIEASWNPENGTPVFTIKGKYATRGWTEWTQGFQFGSAVLQFDATGEERFLKIGRKKTVELMAPHVSHTGVHDHGFNNLSTYGNLLRLMREGRIPQDDREREFYELALKISGAVQAARWTKVAAGTGFIHSFNGPHSLFVDTIRSCRVLGVAHRLGHVLMGEQDQRISLLDRMIQHAQNTSLYNVYRGDNADHYDLRGRTVHEAIFNVASGEFRCPSSQQGYSPFSTWTRGLAWAVCGFAEQLEFLDSLSDSEIETEVYHHDRRSSGRLNKVNRRKRQVAASASLSPDAIRGWMLRTAEATADFYIENSCTDGIPMWDTGAPNLYHLGRYLTKRSNPFNDWEPVDSSAAAIAGQGLIRLGNYLVSKGKKKAGARYRQAGLTVAKSIFSDPYLSTVPKHQGLILHSIYHRPNGWDHTAAGQKVPNGESSMWGDYHARELALMIQREAKGQPYLTFYGCCQK